MKSFREKLDDLEEELSKEFYSLITKEGVQITTLEDIDNNEAEDYFDYRSDSSGQSYEGFITSVSEDGIGFVEYGDTSDEEKTIRFSDLSSTYDRVSLVELIKIRKG